MTHIVELEPVEWQQVISALAMTNPLLVKISTQLQHQASASNHSVPDGQRMHPGNSKELPP